MSLVFLSQGPVLEEVPGRRREEARSGKRLDTQNRAGGVGGRALGGLTMVHLAGMCEELRGSGV